MRSDQVHWAQAEIDYVFEHRLHHTIVAIAAALGRSVPACNNMLAKYRRLNKLPKARNAPRAVYPLPPAPGKEGAGPTADPVINARPVKATAPAKLLRSRKDIKGKTERQAAQVENCERVAVFNPATEKVDVYYRRRRPA